MNITEEQPDKKHQRLFKPVDNVEENLELCRTGTHREESIQQSDSTTERIA